MPASPSNLLPAFPLDGGRILRSILWRWKGDVRCSTRKRMQEGGRGRLVVASGERLEGIIAADDIMSFVTVRMKRDEHASAEPARYSDEWRHEQPVRR